VETRRDLQLIVDRLIDAYDNATTLEPVTATMPGFDSAAAYEVLDGIAARRRANGWTQVGRKIGFTNRTIWELFGVDRPMWAHMWSTTVTHAARDTVVVGLDRFVQPRIEPEVVFKLRERPPPTGTPSEILRSVEWMAPGFEIVHCHFPDWKFTVADATADFGVHGALVVGAPLLIDDDNRDAIAVELSTFELTLSRDGVEVDRGLGANVLDGPAHALAHLIQVLAEQPEHPPLDAGEIVTTGTITNMWPITSGEHWTSDYGTLGLDGLTVSFS
jgi:2-oxo-3-hexenedioate decarboxylase